MTNQRIDQDSVATSFAAAAKRVGASVLAPSIEVLRHDDGTLRARLTRLLDPDAAVPALIQPPPTGASNRFAARADQLSPWKQITFTVVAGQRGHVDSRCLRRHRDTHGTIAPVGRGGNAA